METHAVASALRSIFGNFLRKEPNWNSEGIEDRDTQDGRKGMLLLIWTTNAEHTTISYVHRPLPECLLIHGLRLGRPK